MTMLTDGYIRCVDLFLPQVGDLIMSKKLHRRRIVGVVFLAICMTVIWMCQRSESYYRAVPYEQVVRRFARIHSGWDEPYEVDMLALWKDLGINPAPFRKPRDWNLGSLRWTLWHNPQGLLSSEYAFDAQRGQKSTVNCQFREGAGAKIITITKEWNCPQVLVFLPKKHDGIRSFRFAYQFVIEDGDQGSTKLIEIEPDLTLLEVSYRNGRGTGAMAFAWALYRLDRESATRLLKTSDEGWSIGSGPCGYGYHCEIEDLVQTWPELGMTFFVEYVPSGQSGNDKQTETLLDVYTLNLQAKFLWDGLRKDFHPVPSGSLSEMDIQALVARPAQFVVEKAEDEAFLSQHGCPVTKTSRPQSECLRGWGL